jgi:PKD repeat protein
MDAKRKLLVVLFALYVTFIIISTIPYLAEQNLIRTRAPKDDYVSHLTFPVDGEYDHYKNVVLLDNKSIGKIDLKYTFETNTLYIQKMENVKELVIDCQLMYKNKYKELFGKEPTKLETADFIEGNSGVFIAIINTNSPMEKLQFLGTPLPKAVLVNDADWWNKSTNYTAEANNVTINHIPQGSTTVEIYFKETVGKSPTAMFTADNYIVLQNETITFDASGSTDEDGIIKDYIWDLGDNTKNINKVIQHSYAALGTYTVSLTVRDNDGLLDVYSNNITVIESNKSFQKVTVSDVEIDIRSVEPQNLSIEIPEVVPEVPKTKASDFNFFVNITSQETVSKFQLKLYLGPIGGDIIPAGTDPKSVKLYYYDEDEDNWVEIEDSHYNPITGILMAKLDHLTIFAPMSKETPAEKKGEEEEDGLGNITIIILIIVILVAIMCIFGVLRKRRKKEKPKRPLPIKRPPKAKEEEEELIETEEEPEAYEETRAITGVGEEVETEKFPTGQMLDQDLPIPYPEYKRKILPGLEEEEPAPGEPQVMKGKEAVRRKTRKKTERKKPPAKKKRHIPDDSVRKTKKKTKKRSTKKSK